MTAEVIPIRRDLPSDDARSLYKPFPPAPAVRDNTRDVEAAREWVARLKAQLDGEPTADDEEA